MFSPVLWKMMKFTAILFMCFLTIAYSAFPGVSALQKGSSGGWRVFKSRNGKKIVNGQIEHTFIKLEPMLNIIIPYPNGHEISKEIRASISVIVS